MTQLKRDSLSPREKEMRDLRQRKTSRQRPSSPTMKQLISCQSLTKLSVLTERLQRSTPAYADLAAVALGLDHPLLTVIEEVHFLVETLAQEHRGEHKRQALTGLNQAALQHDRAKQETLAEHGKFAVRRMKLLRTLLDAHGMAMVAAERALTLATVKPQKARSR